MRLFSVIAGVVLLSVLAWLVIFKPGAPPTYHGEVGTILHKHCVPCHRSSGAAPFSLTSYEDARKRARQIVEVTHSRYMPPWPPGPSALPFEDERVLSGSELKTLAAWQESGMIEGAIPTTPLTVTEHKGWRLGEPDLVVRMSEAFTMPVESESDVYRNFVIPVPLDKSRFVKGFEFTPGNPKLAHHAFVWLDDTEESRQKDAAEPGPGYDGMFAGNQIRAPEGRFLSWQPGRVPRFVPDGLSWLLKKGTDLVLQIHMTPTGKQEKLQASIALYFTNVPPSRKPTSLNMETMEIDIPPDEDNYVISDEFKLPVDVTALAIMPHAHYVCRQVKVSAERPDGTSFELLQIDDWDPSWQMDYWWQQPQLLTAGTVIRSQFVYDNSSRNPRNPHTPPKPITFGLNTDDEMCQLVILLESQNASDDAALRTHVQRRLLARRIQRVRTRLKTEHDEPRLWSLLAKMQTFNGEPAQGLASIEQAIRMNSENAEYHFEKAIILEQMRKGPEALAAYEATLKLDAGHFRALNNLGSLLLAKQDLHRAKECFDKAILIRENQTTVLRNLAMIESRLGNQVEAEKWLLKAVALEPTHTGTLLALGGLCIEINKRQQAKTHLESVLKLDPDNRRARQLLQQLKQPEKAELP